MEELAALKQEFEAVKANISGKVDMINVLLKLSHDKHNMQIRNLENKYESALLNLAVEQDACQDAQARLLEAKDDVREAQEKLKLAEEEVSRTRNWFKTRKEKVPKLEAHIEALEAQLKDAHDKIEAMPSPDESAEALKAKNLELEKDNKCYAAVNEGLKRRIQKLEKSNAELKAFNQTQERTIAELRPMTRTQEQMRVEVEGLQDDFLKFAMENSLLQSRIGQLEKEAVEREAKFRLLLQRLTKK
jgi:chromosome segregation ATPase